MAFKLKSHSPLKQEDNVPSKAYMKATRPFYSIANRAEAKVEQALGNPMLKANKKVDKYVKGHSGYFEDIDKIRHGSASMYTAQAISKKLGGGAIGKIAGVIGSNILGAGHEISALNTDHGYINGIVEAGKDMANNFIGSVSSEKNLESNLKKFGNNGMSNATRKERLVDMKKERDSSPLKQEKKDLWKTDRKAYVDSTLSANKNLDFVKRLYKPKKDIATPEGEGPKGDRSTHLMSYDPASKRVYPKVVNEKNKLTYKKGDAAYDYADATKEYIKFPTAEKAEWFSSNYKLGTNVLEKSKSPLHKQKLSPLAAKKKAARDLAYAKTDDRRIKKAHAQRMHRKNPGKKNMDYDHEDGRFESVKQNRGNEGEGTKKESGKKYKIK